MIGIIISKFSTHTLSVLPTTPIRETLGNVQRELLLLLSHVSCVQLCATPQTAAHQALPSLGFSRQEYWSGLPFPSPGDLPDPGIEPRSPVIQADALTSEPPGKPSNITGKSVQKLEYPNSTGKNVKSHITLKNCFFGNFL